MRALRTMFLLLALVATRALSAPPQGADVHPSRTHGTSELRVAADLLAGAIGNRRLVFLGEMHGTQETPALAAALLDRYAAQRRPTILALEMSRREQARIDRYLASRGTAMERTKLLQGRHWNEPHHDGRDSQAMFELVEHVRQLRTRGARVALVAFDGGGTDGASRDLRMAQVLRARAKASPASTLLVLTGNVHAMTRRPPWEMFDEGKRIDPPMTAGRHLADLHPLSINIQATSGAFRACAAGECHVQPVTPQPEARPGLTRHEADSAWDDDLVLPRFTPSPPAIARVDAPGAPARRAVNP